ncbi:MAG: DinB family protein [Planctomycetota bacterium]
MSVQTRSVDEIVRGLGTGSAGELVVRYRTGVGLLDRRLFELSPEQEDARFEADSGMGIWSVRTLVGHLCDTELVYSHRIRRAVAEDQPVLADWDEDSFIDGGLYAAGSGHAGLREAPPVGGFVAMLYTTRQWQGEWLERLGPEAWARGAMHPWYGDVTLHDLVSVVTWHFEHHASILRKKLDHLVGPMEAAGCCSSGGGCACEAEGKAKPEGGGCCNGSGGGGGCSDNAEGG